jgi:hypothetical protein
MQVNQLSAGHQETISVLSNLTILTEEDWEKFKTIFDHIFWSEFKLQVSH